MGLESIWMSMLLLQVHQGGRIGIEEFAEYLKLPVSDVLDAFLHSLTG